MVGLIALIVFGVAVVAFIIGVAVLVNRRWHI